MAAPAPLQRRFVEPDEILGLLLDLDLAVAQDPERALAEHPEAAAVIRDRYRYFVVDEYQDVNPLQKLLLDAWTADREDICVVGDPRQTIFSFTGATPSYLTGFAAEFPDATVIRLVRNYRSTSQVVALANRHTVPAILFLGLYGLQPQPAQGSKTYEVYCFSRRA